MHNLLYCLQYIAHGAYSLQWCYCTTYVLQAYYSTVQHIAMLQIKNTIHCNTFIQQCNILQYFRSAIQYIAILQIKNTIYCNTSERQYNILLRSPGGGNHLHCPSTRFMRLTSLYRRSTGTLKHVLVQGGWAVLMKACRFGQTDGHAQGVCLFQGSLIPWKWVSLCMLWDQWHHVFNRFRWGQGLPKRTPTKEVWWKRKNFWPFASVDGVHCALR